MATYKLIQDIEAEDHILGSLTLRQFLYGLAAAFFFYMSFLVLTKHVMFLLILFLPPALIAAFLAFPFGKDQPTEIWALAKIRFLFKPRKRIWSQSGIKNLVTVTAPKKVELHLTNGLSQGEVRSRLRTLADTLDTRGWASKNILGNDTENLISPMDSDRLISGASIPKPVPDVVDLPGDDMLDELQNPANQKLGIMMDAYAARNQQRLYDLMNRSRPGLKQSESKKVEPNSKDETGLNDQLKAANKVGSLSGARMHSIQPHKPSKTIQSAQDSAILNLSRDNNLSVSTISEEAKKAMEVVVDLRRTK